MVSYKEMVEELLEGEGRQLDYRKELWRKIVSSYDAQLEKGVERALTEDISKIEEEFNKLIGELEREYL